MNTITYIILALLGTTTLLRLWLNLRQQRSIRDHRQQVPKAFQQQVSLQQHQKAANYNLAKLNFALISLAVEVIVFCIWIFAGGLNRLNEWLLSFNLQPQWFEILLLFSFLFLSMLIALPSSLYYKFVLEAQFGFNRSSLRTFFADWIKGIILALVLGLPLTLALLWIITSVGNQWWLAAWALWSGFMFLMIWVFPNWIAPLFNQFKPLSDLDLRRRINGLLQRCGFRSNGILVMDGSKRSSHGNAYFTGLGNSKRIVFFDTLLEGMEGQHIEAILAHELGHFRHNHIYQGLMLNLMVSGVAFYILSLLIDWPLFFQGLMIENSNHAAGLLLFILISPLFGFILHPLTSALSRRNEYQADTYAAEQTNAQDLIEALTRLYRDNASTLTPDSMYSSFYDSHPPAPLRIAALHDRGNKL